MSANQLKGILWPLGRATAFQILTGEFCVSGFTFDLQLKSYNWAESDVFVVQKTFTSRG